MVIFKLFWVFIFLVSFLCLFFFISYQFSSCSGFLFHFFFFSMSHQFFKFILVFCFVSWFIFFMSLQTPFSDRLHCCCVLLCFLITTLVETLACNCLSFSFLEPHSNILCWFASHLLQAVHTGILRPQSNRRQMD